MKSSAPTKLQWNAVHDAMVKHVETGELPGLVTLISRRGEVSVDAIGTTAFGVNAPMKRDTMFRISSMTKPIAAVATMILAEQGRLHLDEAIDRLLPELADRRVLRRIDGPIEDTVRAKRPISVRDLLTMCMGFGYIMESSSAYPIQKAASENQLLLGPPRPQMWPSPDEWIRNLAALPLMRHPGDRWMYDIAFDVLGVLIARAADESLESFLRERIFEPLGMIDTSFSVPPAKQGRLATSYATSNQTAAVVVYDDAKNSQWNTPPAFPSAAGGLVSTVEDYFAFADMLLNRGQHAGRRILSALSVEAMSTDALKFEQKQGAEAFLGDTRSWGLGLSIVTKSGDRSERLGRLGWEGGLGTSFGVEPQQHMVSVLMTQRAFDSPAGLRIGLDFWSSIYATMDTTNSRACRTGATIEPGQSAFTIR